METVWVIWAYYCVAMLFAALSAKSLGASIVFVIGLQFAAAYEDAVGMATGLYLLYVCACVLAEFRS